LIHNGKPTHRDCSLPDNNLRFETTSHRIGQSLQQFCSSPSEKHSRTELNRTKKLLLVAESVGRASGALVLQKVEFRILHR